MNYRSIRSIFGGILVFCMITGISMISYAGEVSGQISVDFSHVYTQNSQEYAVISGVDTNGSIVWTYETPAYECMQLTQVAEIGCYDDTYYFCEGGTIKAVDLLDGRLIWENNDFGGSVIDSLFDNEGNLYVCGYLGPDLIAVRQNGTTAKYIETANEDLYWPYELEWFDETTIEITYEGGGLDQEAPESLYIDISDVMDSSDNTEMTESGLTDDYFVDIVPQDTVSGPLYYVVNCRESITLRTSPSVYASEICQMPLGTGVTYLGYAENGFYYVEYNGMYGYALASYLSAEYNTGYSTYWVVNCRQSITLRKVPSVDGPEICQMPLGSAVHFISRADNGFYYVEYNGQTGYALSSYLSADAYYGRDMSSVCQVVNCRQSITLRTSPSIYASEIMQLPLGVCVNYLGFAGNGFYQVEYNGRIGYALASYLMFL